MSILRSTTTRTVRLEALFPALRRRNRRPSHDDTRRAGDPVRHGPAYLTVLNGGRLPRG